MNLNISRLESDVKLFNGVVTESQRKIETNASNIGTINSKIGGINNCITSREGRITILEGKPD
jgi:peptidoglycan hydrolase CwlO-like protein